MKTCIVTLDFINDICHPDGKISRFSDRLKQHQIIKHANQVIQWARDKKHLLIHVKVGFCKDYIDCPKSSPLFSNAEKYGALTLGEWGTEFCDELAVQASDPVIIKPRVSAFYNTNLEAVLRANHIEHIVFCGVSTSNAVELSVREAHDRDYTVTVVHDACETTSDEEQQASINFMRRIAAVVKAENLHSSAAQK